MDYYDESILTASYKLKKDIKYYIKKYILNLNASYKNVDYFCPVLESEFAHVVSCLNLNAKYVDWNYGSSDSVIERLKKSIY